jgi:DNA-binding NarL/FixJ family response regulator
MESVTIVFSILIIIGMIIIFLAFTLNKDHTKEGNYSSIELDKMSLFEQKNADLVTTVQEADDAIEQLNSLSNHIFEKQEQKYQELLYLYQMIDEKKQELLDIQKDTVNLNVKKNTLEDDNSIEIQELEKGMVDSSASMKFDELGKSKDEVSTKMTKNEQILRLKDQGLSVTQIAKQLNIGQGEVSLVLELKRKGEHFGE